MRSKVLVIASLAAIAMLVLVAISAITVFALVGQTEAVEAAPVIVEPVVQPEVEVVEPIIEYQRVEFTADKKGDCPYNHQVKNQLVQQTEETVGNELLTQAAR